MTDLRNVIKNIEERQVAFALNNDIRSKEIGQFFTGSEVAIYMASMLEYVTDKHIRILDAGAGMGILTAAATLRCVSLGCSSIHAVLYEKDELIVDQLTLSMKTVADVLFKKEIDFTFEILVKDFVLSRPDTTGNPFHVSLINPPYFKYNSKTSPYSTATSDLFKGNPNIYASFMAVVCSSLVQDGQMVSITPRSFTNGLYFKGFRKYLIENLSLDLIHVFKSRNRVFSNQKILQENVICKFTKTTQKKYVEVFSSLSSLDISESHKMKYEAKTICSCDDSHNIIHIPEDLKEGLVLTTVRCWKTNFQDAGYCISTGKVVEHRTRKYIVKQSLKNSVPLLRMHNIKAFRMEWTGFHQKDVSFRLLDGFENHVNINSVYVILKRFSSKDEQKRLTAAVHDPQSFQTEYVGLENHLNYIWRQDGDMNVEEAYGMAALLNSTFMDKYFRCISGNTQVNATEVRLLKFPDRSKVLEIGSSIINVHKLNQETVDQIVQAALGLVI